MILVKNFYSFVYLDDNAIDALYSQIFDDIIEKDIVHSRNQRNDTLIETNFGVLGSNTSSKEINSLSKSVKETKSIASKAQQLIQNFYKEPTSLQSIITKHQPFDESVHFVGQSTFFLSDIYNKQTGISLFANSDGNNTFRISPNDDSVLILEAGCTSFINTQSSNFADTDDYYAINKAKIADYGIIMHISNSKMRKSLHHLTSNIEKAKYFNFYVFGELIKESNKIYQISPFAIWR